MLQLSIGGSEGSPFQHVEEHLLKGKEADSLAYRSFVRVEKAAKDAAVGQGVVFVDDLDSASRLGMEKLLSRHADSGHILVVTRWEKRLPKIVASRFGVVISTSDVEWDEIAVAVNSSEFKKWDLRNERVYHAEVSKKIKERGGFYCTKCELWYPGLQGICPACEEDMTWQSEGWFCSRSAYTYPDVGPGGDTCPKCDRSLQAKYDFEWRQVRHSTRVSGGFGTNWHKASPKEVLQARNLYLRELSQREQA